MIVKNPYDLKAVIRKISGLDLANEWEVLIHKAKSKRSVEQNALYWAWIAVVEAETGNDKDGLHEYFKHKFLINQVLTVFGENIEKQPTTTKLNTKEFSEYMEKIRAFCASELEITLLTPDDIQFNEFINSYNINLNHF